MPTRILLSLLLAASATAAWADGPADPDDLLALSLEQLGDVHVTATSRRASRLADTAASVYVIRGDELRLLGIRTLPEALRLAPNLAVAQIDARAYAAAARGLRTSLSNKMLVMIDGRPIYTPLFAGVLWDMQAVPIEEIDRIEVVSGPGAAAWGANAVNGVISVFTRPARDTAGGLLSAWSGDEGDGITAAQTIDAGRGGALRLYAMRERRTDSRDARGVGIPSGWTQRQAGLRGDWQRGDDRFQLQGDAFRARSAERAAGPVTARGHNLLARWTRADGGDRQWSLQAYHDVVDRLDPMVLGDRMSIAAVEFMQERRHGAHSLTWGLGYRHARDESRAGVFARLSPAERTLEWGHAFVEDEIAINGRLAIGLGLRLDSNTYTGVEVLPTARFSLRRPDGGLLWGAVSRAVRSPARFDRDLFIPAMEPALVRGGPDFDSETATVAELGYRAQPTDWLSFSVTGFHHWHDGLRGGRVTPQGWVEIGNAAGGRVYGVEGWATARMPGRWELSAGVLELREHLRLKPGYPDQATLRDQGNDPEHQWMLRATRRFGRSQQVSAFARHVGELPDPAVPAYVQVDARWSANPNAHTEVGVGVRNLFDERHAELQPNTGLAQSVFGRAVYVDARIDW